MGRSRSRSVSPVRRKRAKEKSKRKRSERRSESREDNRVTRRDKRRRSESREDIRHSRRSRSRSRSRSYERRHRSRSRSPYPTTSKISTVNVSASDLEGKTPDEIEMMKVMGFCGFDTTKGKKVDGNNAGEVHVILKRKYRQYMNRKGGFNRPLDFVA